MQHPCGVFDHNSCLMKGWPRLDTLRQKSTAHRRRRLHHGDSQTPSCLTLAVSVDLFDGWASASATTWHATTWHTSFRHATATCCLVYLHHDGINNPMNLFLLGTTLELALQLVIRKRVPHLEAIVLQSVFR